MKRILFAITILLGMPVSALAEMELPVANGVITSGIGLRVDPFGSGKRIFHRGIDIAVPVGTPVRAIRKGRIVFAGDRRGYGSAVIIEHANGDRTLYGHNSLIKVSSGELVESGTVVAFSGNSGRSTGPHVHFEKLPSAHPINESPETVEATVKQVIVNNDSRHIYEQRMDESINSVLRTISSGGSIGHGS